MVLKKLINWLRGRQEAPHIPEKLWQQTLTTLPFLERLSADEKSRLKQLCEAFLADPLVKGRASEEEVQTLVNDMIANTLNYLPDGWKEN